MWIEKRRLYTCVCVCVYSFSQNTQVSQLKATQVTATTCYGKDSEKLLLHWEGTLYLWISLLEKIKKRRDLNYFNL
jgi:hypothetical protein